MTHYDLDYYVFYVVMCGGTVPLLVQADGFKYLPVFILSTMCLYPAFIIFTVCLTSHVKQASKGKKDQEAI